MTKTLILIVLAFIFGYTNLFAQEQQPLEEGEKSAEELAKLAQNPLANMMSFPFQNNTSFGVGEFDRTSNVLNVQPVLPFFDGHLITRTIIPIVSQPFEENDNVSGIGDISFSAFYAPTPKNGLVWGIGPMLVIPIGNNLSSKKWSTGPSIVIIKMQKKIVYGFIFNNLWSFAGDDESDDVNAMLFNYFFNYNLPKGWYLTTAPSITANWEAEADNTWTVPFGGGVGKVIKLGKIPFNLQSQAFFNVVKTESSGDFSLRFQIQMMLPK